MTDLEYPPMISIHLARFHRLHSALKNDRGVAAACRSIRAFLICDEPKADGYLSRHKRDTDPTTELISAAG